MTVAEEIIVHTPRCLLQEVKMDILGSDLKHNVVRDVGLSALHGLQGEQVPQVKEGPQVHQHWVGQVTNIHSPCVKRKTHIAQTEIRTKSVCQLLRTLLRTSYTAISSYNPKCAKCHTYLC